jgi:hypothetical protein
MTQRNLFKSSLISSGVFVASTDSSRLPRFYVQLLKDTKFTIALCKKKKTVHGTARQHELGCRHTVISKAPVLSRSSDAAWIYPRLRIPLALLHSLSRRNIGIQQSPLVV